MCEPSKKRHCRPININIIIPIDIVCINVNLLTERSELHMNNQPSADPASGGAAQTNK